MEVSKESFIPDIIPPEVRVEEPPPLSPTEAGVKVTVGKKPDAKAVVPSEFHVHHAIIGLAIAGISAFALAAPQLKPITKVAVAGLGITVGMVLVYDDLIQHQEGNCDIATIFNFTPCAQKVQVVRKP